MNNQHAGHKLLESADWGGLIRCHADQSFGGPGLRTKASNRTPCRYSNWLGNYDRFGTKARHVEVIHIAPEEYVHQKDEAKRDTSQRNKGRRNLIDPCDRLMAETIRQPAERVTKKLAINVVDDSEHPIENAPINKRLQIACDERYKTVRRSIYNGSRVEQPFLEVLDICDELGVRARPCKAFKNELGTHLTHAIITSPVPIQGIAN